jgi:hypothetical protein
MKKLVSLVLACAAVAVAAGVALGAPPERFTEVVDYSGSASCGTFDDMFAGHLEIAGMTTRDAKGNPVRDVVQIRGWERNWRADRPSVSMTAKRSFTVIYTYATDTEKNAGSVFTQTAPGQGVLFHDVGNITFSGGTVTIHGPHDVFEQGDAAFCNALRALS